MAITTSAVALGLAFSHFGGGYPGIPYRFHGHVPPDVHLLAQIEASVQMSLEEASTYRVRRCARSGRHRWQCEAKLFFVDYSRTVERCELPITITLRRGLYHSKSGWVYADCDLISADRLFRSTKTRKRYDGTTR